MNLPILMTSYLDACLGTDEASAGSRRLRAKRPAVFARSRRPVW
jgi:hypothetical protein